VQVIKRIGAESVCFLSPSFLNFVNPFFVIGNSICDHADIKRTDFEQTFKMTSNNYDSTSNQQATASKKLKHRQRTKKNDFYGNRTSGTFCFAATHDPPQRQNKKSHFLPTLYCDFV